MRTWLHGCTTHQISRLFPVFASKDKDGCWEIPDWLWGWYVQTTLKL